jgi:hypothetical protein
MIVVIFSLSMVFLTAIANVAYFVAHSNGKKNIRLYTAIVLFAFLIHNFVFNSIELNMWIGLIALVSSLDIIVDWKNARKHA